VCVALQQEVDILTGASKCKGTDLAGQLKHKLARLVRLLKAHVNIMNICYSGGDEGHQMQVDERQISRISEIKINKIG
jgi:hypothetical protein